MKAKTDIKLGRMHDALAAYRAAAGDHRDPKAAAVLDRLSSDERAAAAFAEFGLDEGGAHTILTTCLQADELRRTFEGHVRTMLDEQRKDGRLDRLCKAVEELRLFANELNRHPDDRLSASLRYDPSVITEVKHGLYYLADAIEARRRIAKETVRRLGATRKMFDAGKAAETAAIRWLAEGVGRCCGRPCLRAAADLAEATLGGEVTIDRVRGALRTRRRQWREP
jgi:hypothetical protein